MGVMMGVICASYGAVKGAGHQEDKYKLKPTQASFLLDRLARADVWERHTCLWAPITISGPGARTGDPTYLATTRRPITDPIIELGDYRGDF